MYTHTHTHTLHCMVENDEIDESDERKRDGVS